MDVPLDPVAPAVPHRSSITTRGATLAALLSVVGRPAWWLLALAGFLARGGILLFGLAVVTLPSPLALSNVVAPLLVPFVFGGVTPLLAAVVVSGVLSLLAWIVVGAWIGAATEVVLIRDARRAAVEDGVAVMPERVPGSWVVARVAIAHLIVQVPLVAAIAVGSVAITNVVYAELVNPFEVATPLPLRVIRRAIGPIVVIVVAWLIGEVTGGLAARRIVLLDRSVLRAAAGAYLDLVIRPVSSVLPALLTTLVFALELVAMLAAVTVAWTAARGQIAALSIELVPLGIALLAFVAAWLLALAVAGLIDAWRSVAMTFEAERVAAERDRDGVASQPGIPVIASLTPATAGADAGTFGASPNGRPGDWSSGSDGGSL